MAGGLRKAEFQEGSKVYVQCFLPCAVESMGWFIRVRNGKVSTTDGPYVETKEQLGGYYLIKAKDLNDAVQVASRIPGAKHGTIEVRPIMEFDQP